MTFGVFAPPFRPAFGGAASPPAAAPWYLAGGAPTPIAVYQPKGAASLAASYVNLANPGTYDAAADVPGYGAPTWTTEWVFPDGAAALSTGVAAGAGMTLLVRYSDAPSAVAWRPLAGNQGPAPALVLWPTGDNNVSYRAGGYVNVSPALLAGVLCVAGQQGYRNGVADGGAISTASGTWGTIRIGAVAGYGPGFIGNVQAVAIWAETLTGDQVAAVSAAVALI